MEETIEPIPVILIDNIRALPLSGFIACLFSGKMRDVLCTKGEPTDEEVQTAWLRILGQYYDTIADAQTLQQFRTQAKVAELSLRQQAIKLMTDLLSIIHPVSIYDMIRLWPDYAHLQFTAESFDSDLLFIKQSEVNVWVEIKEAQSMMEALAGAGGAPLSDADSENKFWDDLLNYEKAFKVAINDKDNISTFWYAMYMKSLRKHIEELNKINQ